MPAFRGIGSNIRRRNRRRVLIFVVLSLVLLVFFRNGYDIIDRSRQFATDISTPLSYILTRPIVYAQSGFRNMLDYMSLSVANKRLIEENRQLRDWRDEVRRLESLVKDYEDLLNVRISENYDFVTARVLTDPGGPFIRTVIVNAGWETGVRVGSAVIGTRGLIGRVVTAGAKRSRVLLITDLNSRMPVRIDSSGVNAILAGNNTAFPALEFFENPANIDIGSHVVTSGKGGQVPAGIAIGKVARKRDKLPIVMPYEEFNNLAFVRIVFPRHDLLIEQPRELPEIFIDKPASELQERN